MTRLALAAGGMALTLALGGCYDRDDAHYADNAAYNAAGADYDAGNAAGYADAGAGWPEGARIVVEEGVTYRIDPGGVRVRLGEADSRIEVIDGVRYRIDPGGTRVRIDDEGAVIDVGPAVVPADNTVTVNTP